MNNEAERILEGLKTIKNEIGHFPTVAELRTLGRGDLLGAINKHGGINRFLLLIGLKIHTQQGRDTD